MGVALRDDQQYNAETIASLTQYHYLTDNQKSVLYFYLQEISSDLNHTDQEIAEMAGVSRTTITNCKNNAHFLACLSEFTRNNAKSHVPKVIKALEKKAIEGSVRAQELLIRYTGDYIPQQRNQNVNLDLNKAQGMATGDVISDFVSMLCNNSGWHIEKIIEEIRRAYDKLKSEGNVV